MKRVFAFIIYFPHIILYLFSKCREVIVLDLYGTKKSPDSLIIIISDLSLALMESRYFRTLYYFRNPGVFSKILRVFYPKERSFFIDRSCVIGPGLQLGHPYASIINAESVGANCYINQLVTVGEKDGKKPVIGNNVRLLSNCTVIGGVSIGDGAVIGAGAVVVRDVPAGAVAVGNPVRIINKG